MERVRHEPNPVLALIGAEHFSHSQAAADNVVNKSRLKQIESGPISAEWSIDDPLLALKARLSPLRTIGIDLLNAAIRTYSVLWPNSAQCKSVGGLTVCLQGSETRL